MKRIVLVFIRLYRHTGFFHNQLAKMFFLTDSVCKFNPTCSEYTYQAVQKYGSMKGLWLGLKRIVRCHPWSKGGEDPVR